MRIIVENCVFMNGGDSAINIALRQILEETFPGAELLFADSGHPAINRYYPGFQFIPLPSFVIDDAPPVRLSRRLFGNYRKHFEVRSAYLHAQVTAARLLRRAGLPLFTPAMRAIASYLEADLVVATGGTYLLSKYDYGHRILELRKDAWLGLPVVAFTQSFEPFADDFRARALAPLLDRMAIILVRHETSRAHVRALAERDDHVVPVADSVFALWTPGPVSMAERRARAGRALGAPLRIAVAVRKLKAYGSREYEEGEATFRASICAAVTALVRERGAEVTFVSTCQGIPEYWTDDSAVAAKFTDHLPEDVRTRVVVDRGFHAPSDLIEMLCGFDGVVACRLHMAILAICANAPVLPVSYEPKFEETFAELGMPGLVTAIGEIEPGPFAARALGWADELDAVAATFARAAPRLQASARSAGPLMRQALERAGLRME